MPDFILGGRMGDLIHMMYVVAHTPGKHNLYITDRRDLHSDGFIYDLDKTVEELRPVLMLQDYVNSVQPYNGEDAINLNVWRSKAYSDNWTVLLSKMFGVPIVGEAWIKWPKAIAGFHVKHRSLHKARNGNWTLCQLHDSSFDIGNSFNSLSDLFTIIASCQSFTGEQSLPLAVAHALDVPRTAVLNPVDCKAYMGEEKIFKNFHYVL